METLSEDKFKEWEKKRFRTYFYFCFQKFVAGLVHASYLNASWFYVTVQLKTKTLPCLQSIDISALLIYNVVWNDNFAFT